MATACLLRTRLAFVGEVQNYYQAAKETFGGLHVLQENGEGLVNQDETDNNLKLQQDEAQGRQLQDESPQKQMQDQMQDEANVQ